jgi:hypothetical protein
MSMDTQVVLHLKSYLNGLLDMSSIKWIVEKDAEAQLAKF